MISLGPSVKQLYRQTQELMQREEYEEALESARLLLAQDDKSYQHWMLEGAIRVALGEWRPAERAYQRACREAPNNPIPLLQCANLAMALGQPGDVLDYTEQALAVAAQTEERRDAYQLQAEALLSSAQTKLATQLDEDNWTDAGEDFEEVKPTEATAFNSSAGEVWSPGQAATSQDVLHDLTRGLTSAEKAIALDSSLAPLWDLKGCCLKMLGRWSDAVQTWQQATQLDPVYADYWHELGTAFSHLQQQDDARHAYQKVYELDLSEDPSGHTFLPEDFAHWVERAWAEVEEEWLSALNIDLPIHTKVERYPSQSLLSATDSLFDPRNPLLIQTVQSDRDPTAIVITLYQQNVEREAATFDSDELYQTIYHLLEETLHTFLDILSQDEDS